MNLNDEAGKTLEAVLSHQEHLRRGETEGFDFDGEEEATLDALAYEMERFEQLGGGYRRTAASFTRLMNCGRC